MASHNSTDNLNEKDSAVPESPVHQDNAENATENQEKSKGNKKKSDKKKKDQKKKGKRGRKPSKKIRSDINQNDLPPEIIAREKMAFKKRNAIPHFVKGSIRKIVKDIQPDYTVTSKTAQVCADLAVDFVKQLIAEENMLFTHNFKKSRTIGQRSCEAAFKLKATGEIVNHGISEAQKTVQHYKDWKAPAQPADGEKKKVYNWRKKCGLIIDPVWCRKLSKQMSKAKNITKENSIAKAAVTEYMLAEILELAANHLEEASGKKYKQIKPRNVQMAILNDEELYRMFGKVHIAKGGAMDENIHPNLRKSNMKRKDMQAAVGY